MRFQNIKNYQRILLEKFQDKVNFNILKNYSMKTFSESFYIEFKDNIDFEDFCPNKNLKVLNDLISFITLKILSLYISDDNIIYFFKLLHFYVPLRLHSLFSFII